MITFLVPREKRREHVCCLHTEACSLASEGQTVHAFFEKATHFYGLLAAQHPDSTIGRCSLFESARDFTRIFSRCEKSRVCVRQRVLGRASRAPASQVLDSGPE